MAGGRGLVALGDSITVGEGSMQLGVTALSWAQWLARALDLPYTCYAVNGAVVADVLHKQLPRVRAEYDVAAVYAGVNDVRDPGFDGAAYERDLDAVVAGLAAYAGQLLMLTIPYDLGRPPSAPKPRLAKEAIRRVADRHGAIACDLSDLAGWTLVLPDAVHPTALGQLEIADRAALALGLDVLPSSLAGERSGGAARHAPAHAMALARDLKRRAFERVRPQR